VPSDSRFGFVQFELACPLGPADGRYLRRAPGGGEPELIVVLRTLGARERRLVGGRRPQAVFEAREALVEAALVELNALLRAHRAAAADPYAREIARWHANVVRIGYGTGEQVADGRFDQAYEVPEPTRRASSEGLAPQERLAAILSGSDRVLVAEELVLRARLDLEAGRPREAALQARVALEALLAELPEASGLAAHREALGAAANAALEGDPPVDGVADAVKDMRAALARNARRSV
jgi:hypothetical protein